MPQCEVLKDQQWPSEAIEGISCFERTSKKFGRTPPLQRHSRHGLREVDKCPGSKLLFYHIIDTSVNFHVAIPCEQRPNSELLSQLFTKHWIHWAGPGWTSQDVASRQCRGISQ